ncbi:hypothetical protein [Nostoc sp. FACHB-888]|nr:hypothetical protein [Nostoc sp. FACHB-888]
MVAQALRIVTARIQIYAEFSPIKDFLCDGIPALSGGDRTFDSL